jgi:hypothetical protein
VKQETDNEKMHEGENLTYMLVLRSLPVITDHHGRKGTKENVSKVLYIIPKTLIKGYRT